MSVLSAYFDESYGESGQFTIAGYAFKKSKLQPFEKAWGRMLQKYELPYFRMSSCAHGNGVFKHLDKANRIECQTTAIRLIGKYASEGYGVSFREGMLAQPSFQADFHGMDDYQWACWVVMAFVRRWVSIHNWPGVVRYYFEAGHDSQSQANRLLNLIESSDKLTAAYRYQSHAFINKEQSPAVQAADILAWQANKDLKRRKEGKVSRKDFVALLEAPHTNLVFADGKDHFVDYLVRRMSGQRRSLEELLLEMPPAKGVSGPAHGEELRHHL